MTKKILVWIRAVRAPFFTATIVPVLLGTSIAWSENKSFHFLYFLLALIGAVLINAGTNLANDYFDHKSGNDWANETVTPFSGGSRVIQDQLLSPEQVVKAAIYSYAVSFFIGLYLNWIIGGYFLLLLGILGITLGISYSAKPLMLSYRGHGLGEITVGIGFGPVIVLGAYYIQAQRLSYLPLIASIPIGILILLVLLINEFPDQEADKKTGKHTLTVVLGKKSAAGLYVVLLLFVYLTTLLFVIAHILPKLSLICFFTVPLAVKAAKIILANWNVTNKLIPASSATIALHLFFGLLLTLSFVLH